MNSNNAPNGSMPKEYWKKAPTAGLTMLERVWLKETAERIASRFEEPLMVNIGIFKGASMHCLRAGAPKARLVGIDITSHARIFAREELRAEIIIADAKTFHTEFYCPIHLLFLDAEFRFEAVKRFIEGWFPKVVSGGIVALLCYSLPPPRWEVKRAVDEWARIRVPVFWMPLKAPNTLKSFQRL